MNVDPNVLPAGSVNCVRFVVRVKQRGEENRTVFISKVEMHMSCRLLFTQRRRKSHCRWLYLNSRCDWTSQIDRPVYYGTLPIGRTTHRT